MADGEGKKLNELRVIDLKTELERRGLDKTGNKAALLDRLSKAIRDEGADPDEYLVIPSVGTPLKPVPKRNNNTTGLQHSEEHIETDKQKDNSMEIEEITEIKQTAEEQSVKEIKLNDETEKEKKVNSIIEKEDEDTVIVRPSDNEEEKEEEVKMESKTESKSEDPAEETKMEVEEVKPVIVEKEMKMEVEDVKTLKVEKEKVREPPQPPVISVIETNGIDNEDSINLTIGEDEENLLAEETEVQDRQKDGADRKRLQESKKGDSKGSSSRSEGSSTGKDGTTASSSAAGNSSSAKSKADVGEGAKSSDSSGKSSKRDDKDKKNSSPANASSRNLWVSGLSSSTRATDLKQVFSAYGKVIGAKVVTNARTPSTRCYGYVTMSSSEDAAKCITHLHRTELHGRVISVEKAKGDNQQSHIRKRDSNNESKKSEKKEEKEKLKEDRNHESEKKEKESKKENEEKCDNDKRSSKSKKEESSDGHIEEKKIDSIEKKEDSHKDSDSRSTKSTSKKPEGEREKSKYDDKRVRSWDHNRSHSRSRSRESRRKRDEVLTFAKIREERERQRMRERQRALREEERRRREEERRRREEAERQRETERRQREEAARLEREREKLRRERERIEQEKAELLRLERERQKIEREKLERERLELKRQQMRLEESRRVPPPPTIKRTSSDRRDPRDIYVEPERKRLATEHSRRRTPDRVSDRRADVIDRVADRRIDPSPPSRYESSRSAQDMGLKKDYKRSAEYSSRGSRPEAYADVSRGREVIVCLEPHSSQSSSIDPRQVKDSRYERSAAGNFGREREVRRADADSHRSSRDGHARYSENSKPPGSSAPRDSRYVESNRNPSSWHSGPSSGKSFNSVPSGSSRGDPRNEPSSWSSRSSDNVNRWSNSSTMGNTMRHPGPPMYQGGPMPSMGMAAPGTTGSYDRFDPYKPMASMRKY